MRPRYVSALAETLGMASVRAMSPRQPAAETTDEPPAAPELADDPLAKVDAPAIELTPAQSAWVASLPPERRRRFDALYPRVWCYRHAPRTLFFLLDLADAGPEVWTDRIIAAEVERILGPVAEVEHGESPP
jgi:hypothetical protein